MPIDTVWTSVGSQWLWDLQEDDDSEESGTSATGTGNDPAAIWNYSTILPALWWGELAIWGGGSYHGGSHKVSHALMKW